MWPEWYPVEELEKIKGTIGPRDWNSLYQQNPIPDDGEFFKQHWFKYYDRLPESLNIFITHDDALSESGGDWTEVGVFGIDSNDDIYIIDWWWGQTPMSAWVDVLCEFIRRYNPAFVVGESGVIRKASEPYILKQMHETKSYTVLKWLPTIGDKEGRARGFQALSQMGKVFLPVKSAFTARILRQLLRFPAGVHDDIVDACGLIGRTIHQTWAAVTPKNEAVEMKHLHNITYDELFDTEAESGSTRI